MKKQTLTMLLFTLTLVSCASGGLHFHKSNMNEGHEPVYTGMNER